MVKPPKIAETPVRVCLGRIVGVHGVRGLLVIQPFTGVAEDVAIYGPVDLAGGKMLDLTLKGIKKNGLIASAAGITTREAAEALKGEALFTLRENLPQTGDDEWYQTDLIGLSAVGETGTLFGTVIAVENFGAGDLLEIERAGGQTEYLPFTRQNVPVVDIAAGRISIAPPDGTFEAQEPPGEAQEPPGGPAPAGKVQ